VEVERPESVEFDPRLVRPGHQFDAPAAELRPEIVLPD
jgi:hypothetical protein